MKSYNVESYRHTAKMKGKCGNFNEQKFRE